MQRRAATAALPTEISSRRRALAIHGAPPCSRRLIRRTSAFRDDVLAGLAAPIPAIPARWLYDRRGSELFDEITRLPSYYPTRTETAHLPRDHAARSRARVPQGAAVVEFGAGSQTKTPILLEAIAPAAYVPVDISGDYLEQSAAELQRRFPAIEVIPVVADFARPFTLPGGLDELPKLGFFPGSTIGNFVPRSATELLRQFRGLLGPGSQLLIGMDRVKPVDRLIAAYDDPEGVTAQFTLNLLTRINRELDGDIPVEAFRHEARWNDILSRIEIHLVATRDVEFSVSGRRFRFAKARRSMLRTATNTASAAGGCCCLPAAGRRSSNGRTRQATSPKSSSVAEPERFAP